MNTLKKLILSLLLVCSTSSFANTGGGGFDDPIELFKFYIDLAEEAMHYRQKHGDYNPEHIKKLAPHVYSARKKYKAAARQQLGFHEAYVKRGKRGKHPFIINIKIGKPYLYKHEGTVTIPYTYFKHQQKKVNGFMDKTNDFKAIAKKVGNKTKWYVY